MSKNTPNDDRRPVLVLFDKSKRIIRAGDPILSSTKEGSKEVAECLRDGGTVKTITIAAFRKLKNKWIFD